MNLLTLGLVIQQHSLSELSTVGKIVTLANTVLPEPQRINPDNTGTDLVQIYRALDPDTQQIVYNFALLNRTEVNFLYQEIKFLSEGEMLKDQYADTRITNIFLTVVFMFLFVCFMVIIVYRLNTQELGDSINSDFTNSVITILKYVITGFV